MMKRANSQSTPVFIMQGFGTKVLDLITIQYFETSDCFAQALVYLGARDSTWQKTEL